MRTIPLLAAALAVFTLAAPSPGRAEDPRPSIRAFATATDKAQLRWLRGSGLDVPHIDGMTADVLVTQAQLDALRARGFRLAIETADVFAAAGQRAAGGWLPEYTSYSEAVAELNALATAYPSLTSLTSIGTSVEGRDIWALKISDNAAVDENEPEVMICGNHHCREVISVIIPLDIATKLLTGYGSNPDYTNWVNNREIWIIPTANPDGLVYVENTNLFWRKNRRNNGDGSFGVDLNRNYDAHWGEDDIGSDPNPSSILYRGPSAASEPEVQVMQAFINSRNFVLHLSYHSYGNLLLWGPGYEPGFPVDHDVFAGFGQEISSQNGYFAGNVAEGAIYVVNGDTDDFAYESPGHTGYFGFTPEVGTSSDYFNPPAGRISTLTTEGEVCAWEILRYADRPEQLAPPGQPTMNALPIDTDGNYAVTWNAPTTADTQVTQYEIVEKATPSVVTDGIESGTGAFTLGGWSQSSSRKASGSFSLYSGQGDDLNHILRAAEPYVVQPGDTFTFDAWYSIESNWDYAYAILSTDGGRSFVTLPGTNTTNTDPNANNVGNGITGSSGGFIPMSFDLSAWTGQSVLLGLRYWTDGGVQNEGFYADNLHPVQAWGSVTSLSTTTVPTSFAVAGKSDGTYTYAVRGQDAEGDWGYWSANVDVTVQLSGTGVQPAAGPIALSLSASAPNPFAGRTVIRFALPLAADHSLSVYDVSGRRVRELSSGRLAAGVHAVTWDGRSDRGTPLPSGVYFTTLRADGQERHSRAVLQR
ncbi:immune inhibitor A [bacterium]|nr:immune inhibitor A [bacterium]